MIAYFVENPNSRYVSVVFADNMFDAARNLMEEQEIELEHGDTITFYPDAIKYLHQGLNELGFGVDIYWNENEESFEEETISDKNEE